MGGRIAASLKHFGLTLVLLLLLLLLLLFLDQMWRHGVPFPSSWEAGNFQCGRLFGMLTLPHPHPSLPPPPPLNLGWLAALRAWGPRNNRADPTQARKGAQDGQGSAEADCPWAWAPPPSASRFDPPTSRGASPSPEVSGGPQRSHLRSPKSFGGLPRPKEKLERAGL